MHIKKLVVEFATALEVTLGTVVLVTLLWNVIGHGESTVDWETGFRFATIFGVILAWVKSRETKKRRVHREFPRSLSRQLHRRQNWRSSTAIPRGVQFHSHEPGRPISQVVI